MLVTSFFLLLLFFSRCLVQGKNRDSATVFPTSLLFFPLPKKVASFVWRIVFSSSEAKEATAKKRSKKHRQRRIVAGKPSMFNRWFLSYPLSERTRAWPFYWMLEGGGVRRIEWITFSKGSSPPSSFWVGERGKPPTQCLSWPKFWENRNRIKKKRKNNKLQLKRTS